MIIKKIFDKLFPKNKSLKNRIFNIECSNLIFLLVINIIVLCLSKNNYLMIFISMLFVFILCGILIIANKTKKIHLWANIVFSLMNIAIIIYSFLVPINELFYLYFILNILFVLFLFSGKRKVLYIILEILLYLLITFFSFKQTRVNSFFYDGNLTNEQKIEQKEFVDTYYIITISDVVLVVISLAYCTSAILNDYEKQNNELVKLNEQLINLSSKDGLTGLWNRKYMDDYLKNTILKNYESFSLLMIDIDCFKKFNDKYGHQVGDKILKLLATIIQKVIDVGTIPTRYGGEEFLIIFPNMDIEGSYQVAEKIRIMVEKKLRIPGIKESVTISGGLSTYTKNKSIHQLISESDLNLYKAKKSGKNKIVK